MSASSRNRHAPGTSERAALGRRSLWPLVPIYAAALAVKNAAYACGWLTTRRLQAPVISIGNLSVGGAGKTPLVIHLAQLLAARGLAVDVLSRGYGRRSRLAEWVEHGQIDHGCGSEPALPSDRDGGLAKENAKLSEAEAAAFEDYGDPSGLPAADRYGDEPLLIARASKVPVYVGANRYAAGLLAEQRPASAPRVHLLDDGFQHRQLARAVDIVLLHRSDFAQGLLPSGRLREPLSALARASIAVLRVEDADLEAALRRHHPQLPIWWVVREITPPPLAGLAIAFCGIAHPGEFFSSLASAGVSLAGTYAFADHHSYTDTEIEKLAQTARNLGAARLLTTQKDLARLRPRHRAMLQKAAELQAVALRTRLLEQERALLQLTQMAGLDAQSLQPQILRCAQNDNADEPQRSTQTMGGMAMSRPDNETIGNGLSRERTIWTAAGVGVFLVAVHISIHLAGHSFHHGH